MTYFGAINERRFCVERIRVPARQRLPFHTACREAITQWFNFKNVSWKAVFHVEHQPLHPNEGEGHRGAERSGRSLAITEPVGLVLNQDQAEPSSARFYDCKIQASPSASERNGKAA
jgi:hypothetical protein